MINSIKKSEPKPTLSEQVRKLRTKTIKFLAKIIGESFANKLFDLLWYRISGTMLVSLLVIYLWHPFLRLLTIEITIPHSTIQLWHLLTVLLVAFLIILLIVKIVRRYRRTYYFERGWVFKWKTNKATGEVEPSPYCYVHQTPLITFGEYYKCPDCGSLRCRNTPRIQANLEYQMIASRAKAKVGGHYKRDYSSFRQSLRRYYYLMRIFEKRWKKKENPN